MGLEIYQQPTKNEQKSGFIQLRGMQRGAVILFVRAAILGKMNSQETGGRLPIATTAQEASQSSPTMSNTDKRRDQVEMFPDLQFI